MNPAIGRFMTMDTFAGWKRDPYSLHKYLYVHANPVNMIDPSGHMLTTTEALTATTITNIMVVVGAVSAWHLYNVTHPGDEWSFRECFVWTGWGAMTFGMGAVWAFPAAGTIPGTAETSQRILNLGSGDNPLKQRGVINVDIRVLAEVDVLADANSLPFQARLFDKIISQNPRFHLLTSDAIRVLKPGGRLYAIGNMSNKFFAWLLKANPADYGLKLVYKGPASEELLFGTMKHTTGQVISPGAIEKMQQVIFEKL